MKNSFIFRNFNIYLFFRENRFPIYEKVFQSVVERQHVKFHIMTSEKYESIPKKSISNKIKKQERNLRNDFIYNSISYSLFPVIIYFCFKQNHKVIQCQNYIEIQMQRIKIQIQILLTERDDITKIYDQAQGVYNFIILQTSNILRILYILCVVYRPGRRVRQLILEGAKIY